MSTTMLIINDSRVTQTMIKNIASELHDNWEYIEAGSADAGVGFIAKLVTQEKTYDYVEGSSI